MKQAGQPAEVLFRTALDLFRSQIAGQMVVQCLGPTLNWCEQLFARFCQVLQMLFGVFTNELWMATFIYICPPDLLAVNVDPELNGRIAEILVFHLVQFANFLPRTLLLRFGEIVLRVEAVENKVPAPSDCYRVESFQPVGVIELSPEPRPKRPRRIGNVGFGREWLDPVARAATRVDLPEAFVKEMPSHADPQEDQSQTCTPTESVT